MYQEWGKPARALRPGNTVLYPGGLQHFHGAAADSWFSHIAMDCPGEGLQNEWCEPVDDAAYQKAVREAGL